MGQRVYLDENGNEIPAKVYLDDQGNPIGQPPTSTEHAKPFVNVGGRGTGLDVRESDAALQQHAPAIGGTIGALVGGIPGAAAGSAIGSAARGDDAGEITQNALIGGTTEVGGRYLVAPAVNAVGRLVAKSAIPLARAGIKPTVSFLKQQAGASRTGLTAQANRIAGTLVKNRWTNPEQAAEAIGAAERQLQGELARHPEAVLDTATRVPRYLGQLEASAGMQAMPSHDVATIASANKQVLRGPLAEDVVTEVMQPSPSGLVDEFGRPLQVPVEETSRALRTDISPTEGLDIARATGRWNNRKAWGELKGAEQEASKATERAIRDSVKQAVPTAKPILQKQGEALKALPVLDRMAQREGNRDVVSLPAWVMASHGTPAGGLGAAVANYVRNNQLKLGVQAGRLGPAIMARSGQSGELSAATLRAALLELLANQPEPSTQP